MYKQILVYDYTHKKSALTIKVIYDNIFKKYNDLILDDKIKIFLGKPFGFYIYILSFLDRIFLDQTKRDNTSKFILEYLNSIGFDGVITEYQINKLRVYIKESDIECKEKILSYLDSIYYIDSTIGTALSVAIGFYETSENENIIVILPDSFTEMGEFYENINYMKSLKERNNNFILYIDYNSSTKQNKLCLTFKECKRLLKMFIKKPFKFKIFDTTEIKYNKKG